MEECWIRPLLVVGWENIKVNIASFQGDITSVPELSNYLKLFK